MAQINDGSNMSLRLEKKNKKNQKKEKSDFRLNAIHLFLTYAQCDIECKDALDLLQNKLDINEYIIAQEKHQDGNNHLHVYLKLNKKCNIVNSNWLDLNGYHGKYESCRNGNSVKKYCIKDGNYITNMDFEIPKQIIDKAKSGAIKEAFNMVAEHYPMEIIRGGSKIVENLATLTLQVADTTYQRDQFYELQGVLHWESKYKQKKSLWIHGPTNLGKTEYAKSLFQKPLLVRHTDQLKSIGSQDYDGLIFDDFNVSHWPREAVIHLLDIENPSGINVKHGHVILPKGIPRVFTSNVPIFKYDDTGAIKRRVYYVWCDNDLRKLKVDGNESDESGTGFIPDCHWIRDPAPPLQCYSTEPKEKEIIGNTNWELGKMGKYNDNDNDNNSSLCEFENNNNKKRKLNDSVVDKQYKINCDFTFAD